MINIEAFFSSKITIKDMKRECGNKSEKRVAFYKNFKDKIVLELKGSGSKI